MYSNKYKIYHYIILFNKQNKETQPLCQKYSKFKKNNLKTELHKSRLR